jgi:hypothetical protein
MMRVVFIGLLFLLLSVVTGCAAQSAKTVKTETVEYSARQDPDAAEPAVVEKQVTQREETTTKTEQDSGGLLSGTVHAAGQIIALPFRLVGGLIGLMF